MADHIDGWDLLRERELTEARASREASSYFPKVVAEAQARGYRLATVSEMMNSGAADLFTYRGEVFVKDARGMPSVVEAAATPSSPSAKAGSTE